MGGGDMGGYPLMLRLIIPIVVGPERTVTQFLAHLLIHQASGRYRRGYNPFGREIWTTRTSMCVHVRQPMLQTIPSLFSRGVV